MWFDLPLYAIVLIEKGPEDIYRPGEHSRSAKTKGPNRLLRVCKDVTSVLSTGPLIKARAKFKSEPPRVQHIQKSQPIVTQQSGSFNPSLIPASSYQKEPFPKDLTESAIKKPVSSDSVYANHTDHASESSSHSFQQEFCVLTKESAQLSPSHGNDQLVPQPVHRTIAQRSKSEDGKINACETSGELDTWSTRRKLQQKWPTTNQYSTHNKGPILFRTNDTDQVYSDHLETMRIPLNTGHVEQDIRSSRGSEASLSHALSLLEIMSKKTDWKEPEQRSVLPERQVPEDFRDLQVASSSMQHEGERYFGPWSPPAQPIFAVPSVTFQPEVLLADSLTPLKPQSFTGRLRQAAADKSQHRTASVDNEFSDAGSSSTSYSDESNLSKRRTQEGTNFPVLLCQPTVQMSGRLPLLGDPDENLVTKFTFGVKIDSERDR